MGNHFQIFVLPITSQMHQAKPRHVAGSQIDTEQGEPRALEQAKIELNTFTFSEGSKSLSIDNAVLGPITKSLLFTIAMKTDFVGSLYRNP